jgi:DNA-binding transcriptional MerR regulator
MVCVLMHRHEIGAVLDGRYSLQELAESAGVSTRTIRYYITEGLLEPPILAGHRSYYTAAHLDRLTVIGLLKDAFLPLREIRRRLAGVDDDALPAMIAELDHSRRDESVERKSGTRQSEDVSSEAEFDTASAYIQRLMEPAPAPLSAPLRSKIVPPALDPSERQWRRIAISDDAELTIASDLYIRKKERVDALIEWARRTLGSDEH